MNKSNDLLDDLLHTSGWRYVVGIHVKKEYGTTLAKIILSKLKETYPQDKFSVQATDSKLNGFSFLSFHVYPFDELVGSGEYGLPLEYQEMVEQVAKKHWDAVRLINHFYKPVPTQWFFRYPEFMLMALGACPGRDGDYFEARYKLPCRCGFCPIK